MWKSYCVCAITAMRRTQCRCNLVASRVSATVLLTFYPVVWSQHEGDDVDISESRVSKLLGHGSEVCFSVWSGEFVGSDVK